MSANQQYVYTDASFSKTKLLAVSGVLIFRNPDDHAAGVVPSTSVRTVTFHEKSNIRAELKGVLLALETIGKSQENVKINLYTDCQSITNLLGRRDKLEASHFMSRRKKESLSNADLYQEFFALYDRLRPDFFWVKGHSPRREQNLIRKNFSALDKIVRKELRAAVLKK